MFEFKKYRRICYDRCVRSEFLDHFDEEEAEESLNVPDVIDGLSFVDFFDGLERRQFFSRQFEAAVQTAKFLTIDDPVRVVETYLDDFSNHYFIVCIHECMHAFIQPFIHPSIHPSMH